MRTVLILLMLFVNASYAASSREATMHLGHVDTSWKDTPNQVGLLQTARQEATIALTHANLAKQKPTDVAWVKMHSTHVAHALNGVGDGPGLGYGVIAASKGVALHMKLASTSEGASGNLKLHAEHVISTANNTKAVAEKMLKITQDIQRSSSAIDVSRLVTELAKWSDILMIGQDGNQDGQITWHPGEGGLDVAQMHMRLLRNGE